MTLTEKNTLQGGKYKIIKVLGQGGFGITYLAQHTVLNIKVCIKEFFPSDYVNREGDTSRVYASTQSNVEFVDRLRKRFVSEAQNNCRLNHPGIIRTFDIFEENGTAYYVMDYIEGVSLGDYVKQNGALPEATAIDYAVKIAEALEYIHSQNITHYDLKPDNIMLRSSDMSPVIIDFGLSKQYNTSGHAQTSILVGISKGYSPMEQYSEESMSTFSPTIDVYSLGATVYTMLSGRIPPEARLLIKEEIMLPVNISPTVVAAVQSAMKPFPEDRCQSARGFINLLESNTHSSGFDGKAPKNQDMTGPSKTVVATGSSGSGNDYLPPRENNYHAPVDYSSSSEPEDNNTRNILLWVAGGIIVILLVILLSRGCESNSGRQYEDNYVVEDTVVYEEEAPAEVTESPEAADGMTNSELIEEGRKYYYGRGVEQDYDAAYEYFIKAAENGDNEAQFIIGHMYNNGFGVSQDYGQATDWYLKAAGQGNDRAQYAIGYMYETGHGVPKDIDEAIDWYQKAVDQGNENAEKRLRNL